MIQTAEFEEKVNIKAADYAIKQCGFCTKLREYDSDFDSLEAKSEARGAFLNSECYCKECDAECDLRLAFECFKDGAEWLLHQVAQNLAERYIVDHIGIKKD